MLTIRIFISSPGDVATERVRSEWVIRKLQVEFAGSARLKPYFWEHEPMRATAPFNDPSNIPLTSSFDIVVCILWARMGTPLAGLRPDGTPYPSGTAFELETAKASYLERKAPDLLVYRRKQSVPMPHDKNLREEREKQWRTLDQFIEEWFFDTGNTFKSALTTYEQVSEFEGFLENHLRRLIEGRLAASPTEPSTEDGFTPFYGGNPFLGLEPFQFKDRNLFFGRSQMIEDLLSSLRTKAAEGQPALILHGMSGSGKSSLVHAGVLPLLMQPGVVEDIAGWRRAEFRPAKAAEHPFLGLAEALLSKNLIAVTVPGDDSAAAEPGEAIKIDLDRLPALPELGRLNQDATSLAALLENDPEKLPPLIERALGLVATDLKDAEQLRVLPTCRLILVIDQLEELFSDEAHFPPEVRKRFDTAISTLVRSGVVWCLMTLRSDYLARLGEMPKIAEITAKGGQMLLSPPSEADLSVMIRLPARAAGVVFEQSATNVRLEDRLLEEARNAPDGLPLLGFVLQELYQRMPENRKVLTHAALDAMKGLEGAVATCAEDVFQKYLAVKGNTDDRSSKALQVLVRALATVSDDPKAPPLRRIAPMEPLEKNPAVKDLLDRLVAARLLAIGSGENAKATVQVTHEALFRKWPRLEKAIEGDRKFLECRRRAGAAANHWKSHKRGSEYLWDRGALLAEVRYLLGYEQDLDPTTIDFCKASIKQSQKRKRQQVLAAVVLLLLVAGAVTAFAYRPKPQPAEFSAEQREELKKVDKAALIASLEEQLDNVMGALDSSIWKEAGDTGEGSDEEEEEEEDYVLHDSSQRSYPELEIAEISRRLEKEQPGHQKAFAAGVRADIAASKYANDPEAHYKDLDTRLKRWVSMGQPEDDLLDLEAQIAWHKGDKSKAATLWSTYAALPQLSEPVKQRVLTRTTALLIELKKRGDAKLLLDKWIGWKDSAVARTRRSALHLEELRIQDAETDLAKAEELQPSLDELRMLKPRVELAARYRKQLEEETKAIEQAGQSPNFLPWLNRSKTLLLAGQPEAALQDINAAAAKFTKPSTFFSILRAIATTRSHQSLPDDSMVSTDWRWSSNEDAFSEYLDTEWPKLFKLMQSDAAIEILGRNDPMTRYQRGWQLMNLHQYKLAMVDGEFVAAAEPRDVGAQVLKLAGLYQLKKQQEALEMSNRLLTIDRTNPELHLYRALIQQALGTHPAAAVSIEEAIRLNPNVWYYWDIKSDIMTSLQRKEEAKQAADKAVELKASNR